eukprot:TRINITY_DN3719_c0_g1_i1.p1 TRINITY_DN3719_c0_g1~~TRINITY_DN3719_c0_g1_i1.p1  ORF type:complete len:245 (-),score=56.65 TRINITY_DN3719_c0_g1_i1:366-1100(-)
MSGYFNNNGPPNPYFQGPPQPPQHEHQYQQPQSQHPPNYSAPPNSYPSPQINRYPPNQTNPPYDDRSFSERPPTTPSPQHEYSHFQQPQRQNSYSSFNTPSPPSYNPPLSSSFSTPSPSYSTHPSSSYNAPQQPSRYPLSSPQITQHNSRHSDPPFSQPERKTVHPKYQARSSSEYQIFPQSNDWKLASNDEIISRALKLMNEGMRPFIYKVMYQTYGTSWLDTAQKETTPPNTRRNPMLNGYY